MAAERAARWAWGLLLTFSVAFNLLASTIYHAEYHSVLGLSLLEHAKKGGDPETVTFIAHRLDPARARAKARHKAAKSLKAKRRKAA